MTFFTLGLRLVFILIQINFLLEACFLTVLRKLQTVLSGLVVQPKPIVGYILIRVTPDSGYLYIYIIYIYYISYLRDANRSSATSV